MTKSIWSAKTRSYCLPPLRPAFAPVFMLALAICSASHVCCSAHGVDSSASSSSGLSAMDRGHDSLRAGWHAGASVTTDVS